MKSLEQRLSKIKEHIQQNHITVMILGLGSVGTYLLDYLMSCNDESMRIVVVGRNKERMESNANIVKVSSLIRRRNRSEVIIEDGVDFNEVGQIQACIEKYEPDFIVNSSRVYSGLKYGSISWTNLRAYGIWAPLAIQYIKNIMEACEAANSDAVVINTSYSDAVIAWLKAAGKPYPDFGSGNINHLIPRIKYAVAELLDVKDYWAVDVMFATSHFHDVVISKEGHAEGMEQLLKVSYRGEEVPFTQEEIFDLCKIAMPVDAKRNMMNASSNFDIIASILSAIREEKQIRIFSPGVLGEIGGYPVLIDGTKEVPQITIDESVFDLEEMRAANRESIAFDGIEDVCDGALVYTDELVQKVKAAFDVDLPKTVPYDEIDDTARFLIEQIIRPQLER